MHPSLQVTAAQRTFTANFAIAESPISGNGGWQHLGKPWTSVRTFDNRAIGTQTGFGGYDDSYAYLTGFGPDQTVQATIWVDPATKGDYREAELLLRWADSPTTARGYECNLAWNGAYAPDRSLERAVRRFHLHHQSNQFRAWHHAAEDRRCSDRDHPGQRDQGLSQQERRHRGSFDSQWPRQHFFGWKSPVSGSTSRAIATRRSMVSPATLRPPTSRRDHPNPAGRTRQPGG